MKRKRVESRVDRSVDFVQYFEANELWPCMMIIFGYGSLQ